MIEASQIPHERSPLIELTCSICLRLFLGTGKRENRVGPKETHAPCHEAREKISRILRTVRENVAASTRCPFCPSRPAKGSKYCATHMYRRDPCASPGCGRPVRRNEGQGNQPRHCEKCRGGKRRSFGAASAGGAGR